MPIQSDNIQFRTSQVMDDVPEGGGRATAVLIHDGASNEIFPDISEADRAGGRVRLRKLFLSVDTPDRDILLGTNVVVAKPPSDPNVSVALFSTGDYFDRRDDARNRVEAYLAAGPEWSGYLLEDHIAGQRVIQLFQRPDSELPPVGRTLLLVQDEGLATEQTQYVRVIKVEAEDRIFGEEINNAYYEYHALIVTCSLSDALRYDFAGSPPRRNFSRDATKTKVRDTTVADAAKYYGAAALVAPAEIGDTSARIDSIYTRLVPSAQTETALVDRTLSTSQTPMIAAAAGTISYSAAGAAIAPGGRLVLETGAYPGSISVTVSAITITDDGKGGALYGSTSVGTWNYATGECTFASTAPTASGTASVTYRPAAPAAQQAHTLSREVTAENRSYNWVIPLAPIPAPGAVEFAYMAQGRWYRLTDDGTGKLAGTDPAHGTGTVSFVTGTLAVTTGALPDAGTRVIVIWASPVHYAVRAGATTDAATALELDYVLAHAPVVPGSVTLSYPVGGGTRTITDAAADGNLSGAGVTGTLDYATGAVHLAFTELPDRGSSLTAAYAWRDGADLIATGTTAVISSGQFTVPGAAPFRNGGAMTFIAASVVGTITAAAYITAGGIVRVRDGMTPEEYGGRHLRWHDQAVGTFDASTGVVTLSSSITVYFKSYISDSAWVDSQDPATITGVADLVVERDTEAFDPQSVADESVSLAETGLTLRLLTTAADTLAAGALRFAVTGQTYVDRDGTLYTAIDPATGSGTPAGSVDYERGLATLTSWADGVPINRSVSACLSRHGAWQAINASFRTAASPLRPASLAVSAVASDGTALTGTSDADGNIAGAEMRGTIAYEYGVGYVEFGHDDAGSWVSTQVDPATIRYNAVAYSYLPLDADLLGLDPVRLPSDGRVPIFRPGDYAVFGLDIPLAPQTVTAGQVIDVGVERLSRVRIAGADGLGIATGWRVDLDAGLVTIDDPTGWRQPVTVTGRIEDMVRVSDTQISGDIAFTRPLSHDFPAGATVSSALMLGDQHARVSVIFDQETWDGTWQDAIAGNAATASYDDAQYPPEVTNAGAITERWVIRWTNTTTIQVIGEHVGIIYTGPTSSDVAPANPAADGAPYFRLAAAGFGLGWSAGNVIRLNTVGAQPPIWAVLTVQQGATTVIDDAWELLARGDVDRP